MHKTAAALGLLFAATIASATESFILNVPVRFNANQETGEVRIVLELGAAPTAAQLVVNNAATLSLGDSATVAGDFVRFESGSGNTARITYRPLSNFGADFCAGGSAVEKNVNMRFSGPQDITGYRMSTYVVAAPAAECSKATRRTSDMPATLIPNADGVAPALDAVPLGRLPLDIILVLDKSGSMSELSPDAAVPPNKRDILVAAVQAFIAAWIETDSGTIGDDRIGFVFFDSIAQPQTLAGADPPANVFLRRSVGWDALNATVAGLAPSGMTTIGGGINEAMARWVADAKNDLHVVVVTDGKQNMNPLITTQPSGFLALPPVGGLPQELRARFIPIQTIGFGDPGSLDNEVLKNVSLETAGVSLLAINPSTMYDVFALTLVSILKGNTLSLAARRQGTMSGAGPDAPQPVLVDRSAKRVTFMLQWAPPLINALDLEVFAPGSSTPATPSSSRNTPQAALQSFDIEPSQIGTWSVRVKRAHSTPTMPVPYSLSAFVAEEHLGFRVGFDTIRPATGDTIALRANVSYGGKPLAGLPAGAIRVRVQRPAEGLGTILHNTRVQDGGAANVSGDVRSPYHRKLAQIRALDRTLARDVETVTLTDAKNGRYTGAFSGTSVPGQYGFEVVLDWDDPRTGALHREERLELHLKVRPDRRKTEIATTRDGDVVRVAVTPRDRFGNYLGPGYASLVRADLRGAGTISDTASDPDLTGTYVYTVSGVPAGETPDVVFTVDGVDVGSTRDAAPEGAAGKWRGFVAAGPNRPHGGMPFGSEAQYSLNAGVERILSPAWSLEGIVGWHRFGASSDPQISLGARRWFGTGPWRPFAAASVGHYDIPIGASASLGGLYQLTPKLGLEGSYSFHLYNTSATSESSFSTVQLGIRFPFW